MSLRIALVTMVLLATPRICEPSKPLQSRYWGNEEFIHGYGNEGGEMQYCPSKCTENADFNTHVEGPSEYWKQWDQDGWTRPVYGKDTPQEIAAGFSQGPPAEVQSGVAIICKKPYAVCDYPQGDVFVREALERILKKTTKTQCRASMKIFLCALYRRKCQDEFDQDEASPTYQQQRVYPVCFPQCKNAYKDCGFTTEYANLMCGEYIKAGWVTYEYEANCDDPAARPTPSILISSLISILLFVASQIWR